MFQQKRQVLRILLVILFLFQAGCVRLFGWEVHAPGVLSGPFFSEVPVMPARVALYVAEDLEDFQSKDRGGRTADPQTYFIGEAYGPMLAEAFQHGFEEFILLEAEPTPVIMRRYEIPFLVTVRIKTFNNRVTWRGQTVELVSEVLVMDPDLQVMDRFEVKGSSEAQKVFAKKGGPEVNLNAALENNVKATVQYLQDFMRGREWQGKKTV